MKKPERKRRSKAEIIHSSDSEEQDSEDYQQCMKKKRKSIGALQISNKLNEIQKVLKENNAELSKVLKFSKENTVPMALKNLVKDYFSCKICHKAPMDVPILASTCCGSIIGCESCVQLWYGTGSNVFDKCCPNCRADRGYSHTFRLVGIDEFLTSLRELAGDNNE